MKPFFSVIIPVYNEQDNIRLLYKEIKAVFSTLGKSWEIIFVNDGSHDQSEPVLQELKKSEENISVISFTRNFGQTAAFTAGFDTAQGEILVTLDADLQNDPQDISQMLKLLEEKGVDIVTGWRKDRQDLFLRSLMSRIANLIINYTTSSGLHDLGCSLRIYKKEALNNLVLYGEMHRFLPILASISGAKVVEMPVHHRPRKFGNSKYGLMRTFKVLLDLVTVKFLSGYQTKPIYMFGTSGFIFIFLSILIGIFVTIRAIFFQGVWISPLFVIGVVFFVVGILSILMGLLAEIQIRTWYESSGKKSYIVKKTSL